MQKTQRHRRDGRNAKGVGQQRRAGGEDDIGDTKANMGGLL
jgi:hypothetical protein